MTEWAIIALLAIGGAALGFVTVAAIRRRMGKGRP